MLTALLCLTLRGTLLLGLVWLLDRLLQRRMRTSSRRNWWWIAAAGFLLPLNIFVLPDWAHGISTAPFDPSLLSDRLMQGPSETMRASETLHLFSPQLLVWTWLGGALLRITAVFWQTIQTQRHWGRKRLSTDSALLEILEDSKEQAGVSAPIGLVIAERLNSPAILGWLRPRILLPANFATQASPERLRAVFLHELAHYRAGDLGLNWLFQMVLALHWFNPFAYVAVRQWLRFREFAADEQAITWLGPEGSKAYGETLIATLRQQNDFPSPSGALALGESIQNLKQRILMIASHSHLPRRSFLAFAFGLLLATTLLLQTVKAEDEDRLKARAASSALQWLELIDQQKYSSSWDDASDLFKSRVTKKEWAQAAERARKPLGNLKSRTVASAMLQPAPVGAASNAQMVLIQYHSAFENLAAALETVTFVAEADGQWRTAGYFVRPE